VRGRIFRHCCCTGCWLWRCFVTFWIVYCVLRCFLGQVFTARGEMRSREGWSLCLFYARYMLSRFDPSFSSLHFCVGSGWDYLAFGLAVTMPVGGHRRCRRCFVMSAFANKNSLTLLYVVFVDATIAHRNLFGACKLLSRSCTIYMCMYFYLFISFFTVRSCSSSSRRAEPKWESRRRSLRRFATTGCIPGGKYQASSTRRGAR